MDIKITKLDKENRREKIADDSQLGFGKYFSNHMFLMDWELDQGWINPRIEPYHNLSLDPAAMVLHYGQEVFEGLKAYHGQDGGIYLFRPEMNFQRINRSARRLCMPEIDADFVIKALTDLIMLDKDWIPASEGCSLYIRPTMVATEPALGVRPSTRYLFYIILCPVAAYYPEGFNPVKIYVTDKYVRAVRGGVGEAKTSGNYAASIFAAEEAHRKGFTQVLWLDAVERKYVEEVGTSNIFLLLGDELITPPLNGSILPGVTRDSVLHLARNWGMKVNERPITIDEVIETIKTGQMKEIFASGTAAIISPVGLVHYRDQEYVVSGGQTGPLANKLYNAIIDLQYAKTPDTFGWIKKIG
ncbi:MAG: branched-chain amino acid aminotransferase [Deltaproteobacteria bacterium]|nr:branched-chain amino acid aminotransferase [Deltaproteobacteria bacterium]